MDIIVTHSQNLSLGYSLWSSCSETYCDSCSWSCLVNLMLCSTWMETHHPATVWLLNNTDWDFLDIWQPPEQHYFWYTWIHGKSIIRIKSQNTSWPAIMSSSMVLAVTIMKQSSANLSTNNRIAICLQLFLHLPDHPGAAADHENEVEKPRCTPFHISDKTPANMMQVFLSHRLNSTMTPACVRTILLQLD